MTNDKYNRLRALCAAATPGPWVSAWDDEVADDETPLIRTGHGGSIVAGMWYDGPRGACLEADAAFIAAADPSTVVVLLDAIEAAEAEADIVRLRAWSEEVPASEGSPSDIRAAGWAVGVHNDYRIGNIAHTFWLFTKGQWCVRGEGRTDAAALRVVRAAIAALEAPLDKEGSRPR